MLKVVENNISKEHEQITWSEEEIQNNLDQYPSRDQILILLILELNKNLKSMNDKLDLLIKQDEILNVQIEKLVEYETS